MQKNFLLVAAILGFLGVAFGAFGAHGLRGRLSPEMMAVFEIGVRYQMYHVFALLIGRRGDWALRPRASAGHRRLVVPCRRDRFFREASTRWR